MGYENICGITIASTEVVEFLFKRNFWLAWLFFLGITAWLLARLASFIIAANLQVTFQPLEIAQPTAWFNPVKPPLNMVSLAKLLGIELLSDSPPTPGESALELSDTFPRSSINARLLGTLVSFPSKWSLASIQNNVGTQKTMSVAIGDMIEGASVVMIERDRVIIINNGQREYIDANTPAVAQNPSPPSDTSRADASSDIREVSPNNYDIPRNELEKTLGNLNEIAMQARIMPAFKDGVSQGFRLYSIRPNSLYQKIGIQNGDIVKRINGFDLNSPEKALELYSKLRDSSRIDIEIERNGSPIKKTYNIRAP